MREMEDAARRVAAAIAGGEKIVVHGDYDADGITGAALLTGGLRRLGAVVEPDPHDAVSGRLDDGQAHGLACVAHGQHVAAVELLRRAGQRADDARARLRQQQLK